MRGLLKMLNLRQTQNNLLTPENGFIMIPLSA